MRTQPREHTAAHQAVAKAIREGTLVVPTKCSACGCRVVRTIAERTAIYRESGWKTWLRRVVAHHDDYTKPLDVRWLCTACHGLHHIAVGDFARGAAKRAERRAA